MTKVGELTRRALDNIQPYSPGRPIWEVQKELGINSVIKLASNENPLGPSPKAIQAITSELTGLNRYPDANATALKEAIASKYQLLPDQIIVTNGADEFIKLLSETFLEPGDEIIVPTPSFSEYEFGATLMDARVIQVPLEEDFQFNSQKILSSITEKTKLIYICSPNNPTGTYLPKQQLEQLLTSLPKRVLLILDGAYSHFATDNDYTDGTEFIKKGYPIIALQTFSKIYGLAGIRVGFGLASKSIIENIVKVKEPFNVNSLAQVAATAAITDEDHIVMSQDVNSHGRIQLYEAFSQMGLHYTESMSNFVLVNVGTKASDIYDKLLAKGIIVRKGGTWNMPTHLRISVGTYKENKRLINEIEDVLKNL
ncbi:histidinol-phosphate transaminase [Schinkia sp. CFF1]